MMPALAIFRHRDFARYYAGCAASVIGMFMQQVAVSWLVYRLSGSAWLLGVTAFMQYIPLLVLTPIAGVLADRTDRRLLLLWTQALWIAQAALLAALFFIGALTVAWIIGISLVFGIVSALDSSARNMFVLELIGGRNELPHAIALQAMLLNAGRAIGPAIAGLSVAALGEGWTLALNALLFLPMMAALLSISPRRRAAASQSPRFLSALKEGFVYLHANMPLRRLVLLVALLSLAIGPYQTIMPLFATEQFGGDARTLGLLLGAAGIGALASTFYLASRRLVIGLGRVVMIASVLCSVALALFALVSVLWIATVCMFFVGFGLIATVASTNTILQTLAEEHMRGRVVGIFLMAALGFIPLGSLIAGALANTIGGRHALLVLASMALVGSLAFIRGYPRWRDAVRPMYRRLGMLA